VLDADIASITIDGSPGREMVTKHGHGARDRDRLQHEAAVLEAARHPGVVELVAGPGEGDGDSLTTAWAGDTSLDIAARCSVQEAAAVVASLADTVADLHGLGLVHGRIEPSHVILSPGGRPVLCGFAGGGHLGSVPPDASPPPDDYCDPTAPTGVPLAPSTDVFGLGTLLHDLVVDGAAECEPIPDRRWPMARVRPWTGYVDRALLTIADQATADDPERRPSARELAAAIRDAVPDAHLPFDGDDVLARVGSTGGVHERSGRHPFTLALAAVVLALVMLGVTSLGSAPPRVALRDTSAAATTTTTPAATSVESLDTLPRLRPAAPTPVIASDGAVELGDQRFAVGATGDVLALGDWDCDGVATPAVLRPSTGSVFRFDRWATADAELTVRPAATIIGAVGLRADLAADGCARLVALLADGTHIAVGT
jgi:eukaryotic-like serine/threonine-protein kinase